MRCRILMLSVAHGGSVMPWAGLAAELARRGHQVSVTTTDQFADAFKGDGLEVLRFNSTPQAAVRDEPGQFSRYMWRIDENLAMAGAVKARFTDTHPDVVLYDTSAFQAGRVFAHNWQVPYVKLAAGFVSGPLYSAELDVKNRPQGRASNSTAPLGASLVQMGRLISEYGPDIKTDDWLLSPYEELTVSALPREFQIAGDAFDEHWVFAGPYLEDRAFQGQWQPPGEDPVLLVSFGSSNYKNQRAFLQTCVSAFSGAGWHVVISTGPHLDPADLGPLPPNMEAHHQVPQLEIMKKAKLFISHGGLGGILEALSLGVPILAFPQSAEHDIAGDRITELGLGRTAELDISADELKAAALDLAADAATADSLAQMREHIRKAGGAARAAEEIELYVIRG
jgi:MGT family glycosyltransferase